LGHFFRKAALEKFCPFGLDIFLEFHLEAVLKSFLTSLDFEEIEFIRYSSLLLVGHTLIMDASLKVSQIDDAIALFVDMLEYS
jgi:ferritin-like metal-binding protein YciE